MKPTATSGGGGADTVGISLGTSTEGFLVIIEYSAGVSPTLTIDQVGTPNTHGSGTAVSPGAITTTSPVEVILGYGGNYNANETYTAGGGFSIVQQANSDGEACYVEELITSSAGAQTASATQSGGQAWISSVVSFTLAAGGGGGGSAKPVVCIMQ